MNHREPDKVFYLDHREPDKVFYLDHMAPDTFFYFNHRVADKKDVAAHPSLRTFSGTALMK